MDANPVEKPDAAVPAGTLPENGDAKVLEIPVVEAPDEEEIVAADEADGDELPKNFRDSLFYITSDSGAPPYMVKPVDKSRSLWSRRLWLLFGLVLWGLFIAYVVIQAMYLASRPTSTSVGKERRSPFPFPGFAVCLSTLNATKAKEFVAVPTGGIQGLVNGTSSGMACVAGLGSLGEDIPAEGTCGPVVTQWVDFPFTILPTVCRIFNTGDSGFAPITPGASLSIAGRFPSYGEFDLISYGIVNAEYPATEPLLNNVVSRGVLYRILLSLEETTLIKDCTDAPGGQSACRINFQQQCVEKNCNCRYPTAENGGFDPDAVPGSCERAFLEGRCPTKQPIYPCQSGSGRCTLFEACDPEQACPLPSCVQQRWPVVSSLRPVQALVGARETFILSFTLGSLDVETFVETSIYNGWAFLSGILGLLAGLLGFSVATCCEFCDNTAALNRKKRKAREEAKEA
ncbi:hypothetical protein DFJ74DRAFT_354864 [Hyaloraphidium curvatum]|nr:hypothetical protein DFJ74DRAFT_354864 [Hyaloraphidium curvatum]